MSTKMNPPQPTVSRQQPVSDTGKTPAHQRVYGQLREMILFGELAPGQAVTIQGLIDVPKALP